MFVFSIIVCIGNDTESCFFMMFHFEIMKSARKTQEKQTSKHSDRTSFCFLKCHGNLRGPKK